MEELKDYYEILGLSYTSKPEKELITAAYKAKVKLYHPDVYKGKDSEKIIKDINEAYETLKRKTKKKNYDEAYEEYFYSDDETLDEEEFEEDKEEEIKKEYSNEVNIKDEFYDDSFKKQNDYNQNTTTKKDSNFNDQIFYPKLITYFFGFLISVVASFVYKLAIDDIYSYLSNLDFFIKNNFLLVFLVLVLVFFATYILGKVLFKLAFDIIEFLFDEDIVFQYYEKFNFNLFTLTFVLMTILFIFVQIKVFVI